MRRRRIGLLSILSILGLPAFCAAFVFAAPISTARAVPAHDPAAPVLARLAAARTHDDARETEAELLGLWTQGLSPTVRLLSQRAARKIGEKKFDAAVSDMDDALALQSDASELWRRHALAEAEAGALDDAVKDLGGALAREPRNVFAWRDLSLVEEHRGDAKAALLAWQKLLVLDPKTENAAARTKALNIKINGRPT